MHAPLPALARTEVAPHRSHVNPSTLPQSSESAAPTSAAAMELLRSLDPPADLPLVTYPVSELDGDIVLELPEGEIPINA